MFPLAPLDHCWIIAASVHVDLLFRFSFPHFPFINSIHITCTYYVKPSIIHDFGISLLQPINSMLSHLKKSLELQEAREKKDQHHDSKQRSMATNSAYPGVYGVAPAMSYFLNSNLHSAHSLSHIHAFGRFPCSFPLF